MEIKITKNRTFCQYCKGPIKNKKEIYQGIHNSCKMEVDRDNIHENVIDWLKILLYCDEKIDFDDLNITLDTLDDTIIECAE